MLTLTLFTLVKLLPFLPTSRRALSRYLRRSAGRQLKQETDLWLRARWDIHAAKRLRRRLADRADMWDRVRRNPPRFVQKDPRFVAVNETLHRQAFADLAELDNIIARIYGATGSATWHAHEAAQPFRS